jgi:hypothetical protein
MLTSEQLFTLTNDGLAGLVGQHGLGLDVLALARAVMEERNVAE